MKIDTAYINRIADDIKLTLGDDFDQETFLDTLDGETDVMDVIGWLIQQRGEAQTFAAACKQHAAEYTERQKRLEVKAKKMASTIGDILDATEQTKITHPLATVSRTKGRQRVVISDESAVPSQLCVTTVKPDSAAIKKQLEAGEEVPGAELVTGDKGVTIRVK